MKFQTQLLSAAFCLLPFLSVAQDDPEPRLDPAKIKKELSVLMSLDRAAMIRLEGEAYPKESGSFSGKDFHTAHRLSFADSAYISQMFSINYNAYMGVFSSTNDAAARCAEVAGAVRAAFGNSLVEKSNDNEYWQRIEFRSKETPNSSLPWVTVMARRQEKDGRYPVQLQVTVD